LIGEKEIERERERNETTEIGAQAFGDEMDGG